MRFTAVTVVDCPQGDAAIAAQLQRMVDEAVAKKDQDKIRLNKPLKTVIRRLEARAVRSRRPIRPLAAKVTFGLGWGLATLIASHAARAARERLRSRS